MLCTQCCFGLLCNISRGFVLDPICSGKTHMAHATGHLDWWLPAIPTRAGIAKRPEPAIPAHPYTHTGRMRRGRNLHLPASYKCAGMTKRPEPVSPARQYMTEHTRDAKMPEPASWHNHFFIIIFFMMRTSMTSPRSKSSSRM